MLINGTELSNTAEEAASPPPGSINTKNLKNNQPAGGGNCGKMGTVEGHRNGPLCLLFHCWWVMVPGGLRQHMHSLEYKEQLDNHYKTILIGDF